MCSNYNCVPLVLVEPPVGEAVDFVVSSKHHWHLRSYSAAVVAVIAAAVVQSHSEASYSLFEFVVLRGFGWL